MIQNCDLLGGELPNVLRSCKTLEDLEAQISGHVNKRSDTKVDAELRKKVKAMAAHEGPVFAEAYGKISAYSKILASGSLSYQERPMQTFTAAWCATTPCKHGIVIAAPAEGKTFSMLHLARYMIEEDNTGNTEVVIYSPVDAIASQTKEKLCMFDCSGKVTVTCRWDPEEWKMNRKNKVFLIDEGEEVIERRLLDLKKEGFTGLLGLRDFKVVLFTATLTDYYRKCWRRAFQASHDAVRTFPTQHQVKADVEY